MRRLAAHRRQAPLAAPWRSRLPRASQGFQAVEGGLGGLVGLRERRGEGHKPLQRRALTMRMMIPTCEVPSGRFGGREGEMNIGQQLCSFCVDLLTPACTLFCLPKIVHTLAVSGSVPSSRRTTASFCLRSMCQDILASASCVCTAG